jgi:hypothetical protein
LQSLEPIPLSAGVSICGVGRRSSIAYGGLCELTTRTTIAAGLALAMLTSASDVNGQNWAQTQTETIWHQRYTNCDKGYFVDSPAGVIAHDTPPPSPNHGFLIRAADPSTRLQVRYEGGSLVGVEDEYNSLMMPTADAQLKWEIQNTPGARLERERKSDSAAFPQSKQHIDVSWRENHRSRTN